jgi:NAD-dependent SIR2 family protein deacetylase
MKNYYNNQPNGYLESIQKGLLAVRSYDLRMSHGIGSRDEQIARLKNELETADAIVVGAGAGLSTAAGFTYTGDRFKRYFSDFEEAFGFHDMYTGGFVVMNAEPEVMWAYWARHIYFNRYLPAPKPVYSQLLQLLDGKDYFVITTNVDHQFQRAGFDKKRLFYTQGDYGLFQSVDPKVRETFDNEEWTMRAMEAQGFVRDEAGIFRIPENGTISMKLPTELIPTAPNGDPVTMNLRSDDTFVEDAGWHAAAASYAAFLKAHEGQHVLFFELGVGANTPVIIKYPFWAMTADNPNAIYACLNYNEAVCPKQIESQSICIGGDSGEVLQMLIAL